MPRTFTRILLNVLLASLVFHFFAHTSQAEVNDDYALKISLENQLERKLKQVIQEITGTDKVVIFVNAELVSARGGGGALLEKRKENALVLPGVPEKTEFGSGQTEVLMGAGGGKYAVTKITVSMWIDKSVPDSIVELIKDIAKNVVSFSQSRGDQISVKKVDVVAKRFYWSSLFLPPNLYWFVLTLSGAFLLGTVGIFFMDPLKKVVPALKEIDWQQMRSTTKIDVSSGGDREAQPEREIIREHIAGGPARGVEQPKGEGDRTQPFSFTRELDVPNLAFLLKDRTAQEIAIVVNYLSPALSIRLLELFPKEKQVEVALLLGREEIINNEKLSALEDAIKSKLTYVIGGEDKLMTFLDMTNEDVRDTVFKTLEAKDAKAATRLKQKIKSLETIIRELPAQGIQVLYRNTDVALFAQIVKASPEDLQQKVISSLSAGAAERFKEEMELSRPLSSVRLKREKQNLMVLVRRLISEGLVEL